MFKIPGISSGLFGNTGGFSSLPDDWWSGNGSWSSSTSTDPGPIYFNDGQWSDSPSVEETARRGGKVWDAGNKITDANVKMANANVTTGNEGIISEGLADIVTPQVFKDIVATAPEVASQLQPTVEHGINPFLVPTAAPAPYVNSNNNGSWSPSTSTGPAPVQVLPEVVPNSEAITPVIPEVVMPTPVSVIPQSAPEVKERFVPNTHTGGYAGGYGSRRGELLDEVFRPRANYNTGNFVNPLVNGPSYNQVNYRGGNADTGYYDTTNKFQDVRANQFTGVVGQDPIRHQGGSYQGGGYPVGDPWSPIGNSYGSGRSGYNNLQQTDFGLAPDWSGQDDPDYSVGLYDDYDDNGSDLIRGFDDGEWDNFTDSGSTGGGIISGFNGGSGWGNLFGNLITNLKT